MHMLAVMGEGALAQQHHGLLSQGRPWQFAASSSSSGKGMQPFCA
jgi:hypothetical protein